LLASVVPKPGEGPQRKHYITNIIVMLAGEDRASAQSDYLVIRESPAGLIPVMSGTYLDMFVKREARGGLHERNSCTTSQATWR
jgi:hypothetical protein